GGLGGMCLEELLDVVVAEGSVDAVAALDDHVSRTEFEGEDVDRDDELSSETARKRVAAWLVAHPAHPGGAGGAPADPWAVRGQLGEGAIAEEPEPAVAHVGGDESATDERRGGERGGHPQQLGHGDRLLVDRDVRRLDGASETRGERPRRGRLRQLG